MSEKNCINNRSVYPFQKADPTQFLQVHGRKCKIHLEASVAAAAENPAIMQVIFRKQNTCFCSTYNYILTYLYDCPTSDASCCDPFSLHKTALANDGYSPSRTLFSR